jgi:hypothetical protein
MDRMYVPLHNMLDFTLKELVIPIPTPQHEELLLDVCDYLFQDIYSYPLYMEVISFNSYLQMDHAAVPRDEKWYGKHRDRCKIKRNHIYIYIYIYIQFLQF